MALRNHCVFLLVMSSTPHQNISFSQVRTCLPCSTSYPQHLKQLKVFLEGFLISLCVSQTAWLTFLVSLLFPGSYFCRPHVCTAWDSSQHLLWIFIKEKEDYLPQILFLGKGERNSPFFEPKVCGFHTSSPVQNMWNRSMFFCYLSHKLYPCSFLFPLPHQWNKFLENRGHVSFIFAGPALSTVPDTCRYVHNMCLLNEWMIECINGEIRLWAWILKFWLKTLDH